MGAPVRPGAWPGPGERWRRAALTGRPDVAPRGPVRDVRAGPGMVEGTATGAGGAVLSVALLVDLLGPAWRGRWLSALAAAGAGRGPEPGDGRVEKAARAGHDPVPPPGSVRARCGCRDWIERGWCGHCLALAEVVAAALDGGAWDVLWRMRGLTGGQTLLPLAADGAAAGEPAAPGDGVDDSAFWGTDGGAEPPKVRPWEVEPAAIARLGPLPAARGQAAATEPILAHYRRVRDALHGPATAARQGPRGPRRGGPSPSQENEA